MKFTAKFNQAYFNKISIALSSTLSTLQLTEFRQHMASSETRFESLIFIFIDIAYGRKSK